MALLAERRRLPVASFDGQGSKKIGRGQQIARSVGCFERTQRGREEVGGAEKERIEELLYFQGRCLVMMSKGGAGGRHETFV